MSRSHRVARTNSRPSLFLRVLAALAVSFTVAASPGSAQTPDNDGMRFGLSFGGVSTVGVLIEFFDGNQSLDFTIGTWAFKDVSVSAVAKRYMGDRAVRPYVGAGLWLAVASPAIAGERTGLALVFRAPVGVDWRARDDHSLGLAVNLNRGLLVRRSDPEDTLPMNGRLVPLPGLYYRYTSR